MQQEILEVIEKNLPAQIGEILKKRLILLDDYETQIKELNKTIERNREDLSELKKNIKKLEQLKLDEQDINERIKAVAEKERLMQVFELELKLSESEKRITEIVNFASMVLKSPVYRKTTNENTSYYTQYVDNAQKSVPSKTITETFEQE